MTENMPWDDCAQVSVSRVLRAVARDCGPDYLTVLIKQVVGEAFNQGMGHALDLVRGEAK